MDNTDLRQQELLTDLLTAMNQEEVVSLGIELDNTAFEIKDHNQAMYFLRQYKELEEEAQSINAICDKQIKDFVARIEDWRKDQIERVSKGQDYMSGLLKSFAERELEGAKKRSIKLPFGTIGFSKQQPEYAYDEEIVKAFLKQHNLTDFTKEKVTVSLDKKELKSKGVIVGDKLFINNVPIEGVIVTEREDKFSIK